MGGVEARRPCADTLATALDSVYGLLAGPEAVIDAIGDWREFHPRPSMQLPLALPDGWDC